MNDRTGTSGSPSGGNRAPGRHDLEGALWEMRETLLVGGRVLELVARRPVGGNWTAWVRRRGAIEADAAPAVLDLTAAGPTAAAALALLVARIRDATGAAHADDR